MSSYLCVLYAQPVTQETSADESSPDKGCNVILKTQSLDLEVRNPFCILSA